MLPSFARTVVTVIRPAVTTERGSNYPDWAAAAEHKVTGCSFQPGGSTEDLNDGRDAVRIDATVYLPARSNIAAGDRIRVPQGTFNVVGEPEVWESPTGRMSHVIARLVKFRG